uniref:Uncharacterized protein n=1 Tax=Anguilla anguilla TaxID=7936 RepID=A0A0E9XS82_ANGAN
MLPHKWDFRSDCSCKLFFFHLVHGQLFLPVS